MKKLLSVAAMALAMALAFTSCASSGAKSEGSGIPHPRSYVLDVIDGGETLNLVWNQYGPNYQATPFFTNLVKKDKPQAGDTVVFKMKATTDVDLPLLLAYPCSTSPSWTGLAETVTLAENVKAGETFDVDVEFVLYQKMGGDFALCIQYDNEDQEVKTGGPCVLTLERVCESTDTTKEVPETPHNSNPTVDLGKQAAFLEIATNHPWINGAQDMSVISNYEATPEVTKAFKDDLPKAGDVIHVKYKAVADVNIEAVYIRAVDCSAAANWWKELCVFGEGEQFGYTLLENVEAGVPFDVEIDIPIAVDPVAQVNFCIWYDCGTAEPDGPALLKLVKD